MGATRLDFFTTTDEKSDRAQNLARLIISIDAHCPGEKTLHLLVQNATAPPSDLPAWVRAHTVPERLSLSQARNLLLARVTLTENDIVAFPDDDCWYPRSTLEHIHKAFEEDNDLDLLITRYSAHPTAAEAVPPIRPSLQTLVSRASSNTIFLRGSLVAALGPFDERLGLGTFCSGGEDTDFALRASRTARSVVLIDALLIGHRDPNPALRGRYYPGSLAAIAKHTAASPTALPLLLRKIGVGAWLTVSRKLALVDYLRALRSAFAIGATTRRD